MNKCNEDFCIFTQREWGLNHQKTVVLPIDMKDLDIFQDAFFVSLQHLKFRGPTYCTNLQQFFIILTQVSKAFGSNRPPLSVYRVGAHIHWPEWVGSIL